MQRRGQEAERVVADAGRRADRLRASHDDNVRLDVLTGVLQDLPVQVLLDDFERT